MLTMTNDWKFGYILGALTGDGTTYMFKTGRDKPRRIVSIMACDREMVAGVAEFCIHFFNTCEARLRGPRGPYGRGTRPYYEWATMHKPVVEALTKDGKIILPSDDAGWRGFIGGFFDAEGSHLKSNNVVICCQKGNDPLMEKIQEVVESYGISTHLKVYKDGVTYLYARGYSKTQIRDLHISPQQNKLRGYETRRRFFEVFRPLIKRKYRDCVVVREVA